MTVTFPKNADDLTDVWMSQALGRPVTVSDVQRIGVNEGFTGGGVFRVFLSDESLVVKVSPSDPKLRNEFKAANAREVKFYTAMLEENPLPVPRCHYCACDENSGASVLVLDDLGAGRSVPFVEGCSLVDAERVVDALADIHRTFWNSSVLEQMQGVGTVDEFDFEAIWARYEGVLSEVLDGTDVPPILAKMGDYLAEYHRDVMGSLLNEAPITLLHRDVQVDNILFHLNSVSILDWQFVGKGRAGYDLAYFLISSLDPVLRRTHELDLVTRYVNRLARADYCFDQCWKDYVLGVFGKINVTVIATVLLDNSGAHKKAWRRADLERVVAFCTDHDALKALG